MRIVGPIEALKELDRKYSLTLDFSDNLEPDILGCNVSVNILLCEPETILAVAYVVPYSLRLSISFNLTSDCLKILMMNLYQRMLN